MTTRYIVFNSGHLAIAAAFAASLFCIPAASELSAEGRRMQESRAPAKAQFKADQEQLRELSSRSSLAIDRVKSGACVPIVDKGSGVDIYFSDWVKAEAKLTTQPMSPGTLVCNIFGETAIVGNDGQLNSPATATLEDKEEYRELYQKLLNVPIKRVLN